VTKNVLLTIFVATLAAGLGGYIKFMNPDVQFNHDKKENLNDFVLMDLLSNPHSVNEWQGKIRIINFWATWCPPCLEEIPGFIELQEQYAEKNIQFIGVAIDNKESVTQYLTSKAINYPVLLAENEGLNLAKELGNTMNVVPYTVIVNQQGYVIKRHQGQISKEKLREIIASLIQ